tara:strand:+ start:2371 stop:2559 length:189 start_codon:yes stop_codon:yes gene_type:complete
MTEHFFQCPYCWEEISVLIEIVVEEQDYIEDCEVCCRPINLKTKFKDDELISFESKSLDDSY